MLFLACSTFLLARSTDLLVSELRDKEIILKVLSLGRGDERTIYKSALPFSTVGGVDDQIHNQSLIRSFAFSIDPRKRRIALLNVTAFHSELDSPKRADFPGWSSDAELITLDYKGGLIRKNRVRISGGTGLYIGIGESGFAELIREDGFANGKQLYSEFTESTWKTGQSLQIIPSSFRSLVEQKRLDKAILKNVRNRSKQVQVNAYPFTSSPAWADVDLPGFTEEGDLAFSSTDSSNKAQVIWTKSFMTAKWGKITKSVSVSSRAMDFVFPLHYPYVIGQLPSSSSVYPGYERFPLAPVNPYVPSAIWSLDLVENKKRRLCSGLYALPMQ
ncbi:hypothetical protein EON81_15465 [bacterium]|nr:MAG: hypothetical protein EON81_15465 [bacterium]